ncbi:MAG: hypothetical protein WKG06_27100 [Segetibacter sp.]
MFKNKRNQNSSLASNRGDASTVTHEYSVETETGTLEITGTGIITVRNTGGSSASEGGMGSDSDDDKTKGDISKSGGAKSGNRASDKDDSDITFDPIKKNVREAEKEQGD